MPCLRIFTNLAKDKIPEGFLHKIIPVLSQTVRKPENMFVVMVSPECPLTFGGDKSHGVIASLESIGHLGVEENKVITREVTNFIHKELGIQRENVFLSFYDMQAQNIGKAGITFA